MTRLGPVDGGELPDALEAAFRQARLELGEVPDVLTRLAHAPEAANAVWALVKGVLLEGAVPRTTKELIVLAAAAEAEVNVLRDHVTRILAERGLDADVLADVARAGETARLPERTQLVLAFGRRAALQPALLTDGDFQRLRRAGLTDAELAELLALAGTISLVITVSRAFTRR